MYDTYGIKHLKIIEKPIIKVLKIWNNIVKGTKTRRVGFTYIVFKVSECT